MAAPYTGTGGSGEAVIRGIDINKLVEGFAEEGIIIKNYVRNIKASAREMRYYSKTAGFLTGPTTIGITTSLIANTASGALPVVAEPQYTRATAWIRKYMLDTPLISIEDLNDCDPDIWADMIKDTVRAVNYQIDSRIYTVLSTATGIQTGASTGPGWNVVAICDPIKDFTEVKQKIRSFGYDANQLICYINSIEEKYLINYLISVKGSSIPNFASDKIKTGQIMELLNVKIVVSENATTDQALFFVDQTAGVYKEFMPITTAIIDTPGIGKIVRCWAEGEPICVNPKAVYLLSNTYV